MSLADNLIKKNIKNVLTLNDIIKWNKQRNIGADVNTEVNINNLKWQDMGNYLEKNFYVKDNKNIYIGLLRTAYTYYHSNELELIIINDENYNEIQSINP